MRNWLFILLVFAGYATAECMSQKIDGINVITCPEYRAIEERTVRTYTQPQSHPMVVQGAVAQVQPGYSTQELTRELNERYKAYGGYKPGYTLTKGKGWYSWHK